LKAKFVVTVVTAGLAITITTLNTFGFTHWPWFEGCAIGVVAGMAIEGLPE